MAYEFRADRPVGKRTRKLLQRQIDKAIGDLCNSSDLHTGVHEARKRLKKCRALLRLVRDGLGRFYARENQCFRDAGRKLSTLRDAGAMVETFDLLMRSAHAPVERVRFAHVRVVLIERRDGVAEGGDELRTRTDEVVRDLRAARLRMKGWPDLGKGPDVLFAGYEKTYRAGRDAFREAVSQGTEEAFHDWRKRVKEHRDQTRLLRPVWPAIMQARENELTELGEWLGNHHNLAVFRETLRSAQTTFAPGDAAGLLKPAAALQAELESRACSLGRRLYAEKPGALLRRIRAYWKASRRDRRPPRPRLGDVAEPRATG